MPRYSIIESVRVLCISVGVTMRLKIIVLLFTMCCVWGEDTVNETDESENDTEDSAEKLGPALTQIYKHPYVASVLYNDSYVCSSIILNKNWLLTMSKCFQLDNVSAYYARDLSSFSVRCGSSYNNKGGELMKIRNLISNYEVKVTVFKLDKPLEFSARVNPVRLPNLQDEPSLGYLATMVAWTPNGHMRSVSAPVVDPTICETFTKLGPNQYICLGGVLDPNRHFCRKDDGGPVIQNNTLIGISTFIQKCALYTRTHAFPRISSISHWLDALIWDDEIKSTTIVTTTTNSTTAPPQFTEKQTNPTDEVPLEKKLNFSDRYMLTIPFDPINVPLQPGDDNSVMPGGSLYEAYLEKFTKKTTTTQDPINKKIMQKQLKFMNKLRKYGKSAFIKNKYDTFDY